MNYQSWALQELGLAGPSLKQKLRYKASPEEIKKEARQVGRKLLFKYHPDRNKDPDASEMFRAVNDVLSCIDSLPLPEKAAPEPQVRVSVSFYPERSPYSGYVKTKTVRTTYFDREDQKTKSSGVKYDAKKVIPLRPKFRG